MTVEEVVLGLRNREAPLRRVNHTRLGHQYPMLVEHLRLELDRFIL